MRNPQTIQSLRLRETIADFELKMNSLGFKKPQHKEFKETSASDIQKFLENKIKQQNQEYLQKNTRAIEKSGGYSNAQSKSSDLHGYTDKDQKTQINNLLNQAVYNQGKGSFKERNASVVGKTVSLFKKALSSTSISSGGNHPQQQNSTLQKSQSLPTQNIGQKAIEVKSRGGYKNLKRPNPLDLKKQKSKESLRKRFLKIFTLKKTKKETQSNGTSRSSAKPIKVKDNQLSNNKLTQRNSSFASSRGNSVNHNSRQSSNLSTDSHSFGSIASRNQSLSQSRSNSSRGNSFSSQGSFDSRSSSNSQTSRVNQSRRVKNNNSGTRR